jgi:hypothetical protein
MIGSVSRIQQASALGVLLLGMTTGCAESVYKVQSPMPVLLGPVDRVGGGARPPAGASEPTVDAEVHRSGGTIGTSIDNIAIDTAIGAAATRARVGATTGDVRIRSLAAGGYIFWSIPYLTPVLIGRTWMSFEGDIARIDGAAP